MSLSFGKERKVNLRVSCVWGWKKHFRLLILQTKLNKLENSREFSGDSTQPQHEFQKAASASATKRTSEKIQFHWPIANCLSFKIHSDTLTAIRCDGSVEHKTELNFYLQIGVNRPIVCAQSNDQALCYKVTQFTRRLRINWLDFPSF